MFKKSATNFNPEEYNSFEDEIIDKIEYSDYTSEEDIISDLEKSNFQWRKIKLKEYTIIIIELKKSKEEYVIEYRDGSVYFDEIMDWFYNIADHELYLYVDYEESDFWEDEVYSGMVLYHATKCENIPSIRKEGLNPRSDSRGMTNRFMPSGVFTSSNPYSISPYGDCVVKINAYRMKEDGYMPEVRKEEGMDEAQMRVNLANIIGLENVSIDDELNQGLSQGLSEDTVVFLENIPPKYLDFSEIIKSYNNWYKKSKQEGL